MKDTISLNGKTGALIAYVLEHPGSEVKVTGLAKLVKANKGTASLAVKRLTAIGIIRDKRVNLQDPLVRSLKVLLTVEKIIDSGAVAMLKRHSVSAGLYGSAAKGTDTEDSDLDIWIRPKRSMLLLEAAKLSTELGGILKKEVQVLPLDNERLSKLRNENENLYFSLVFGSVLLFGDGIE